MMFSIQTKIQFLCQILFCHLCMFSACACLPCSKGLKKIQLCLLLSNSKLFESLIKLLLTISAGSMAKKHLVYIVKKITIKKQQKTFIDEMCKQVHRPRIILKNKKFFIKK